MDLRLTRFGPSGVLVHFADRLDADSLARCRGLVRWIDEHPQDSLVDCVPACDAILLEFEGPISEKRFRRLRTDLKTAVPLPAEEATLHEVAVFYDGPDLLEFAERKKLTVEEVIVRHSAETYSVYVIGFSPGFPYLGPLDGRLYMPRRASPRLRVPAGSVAIGGEHTGIYSISSPGGWWLIGRTENAIFSPGKAEGAGEPEAFLLRPGDRVRFTPIVP
jgi:KipI family sensor histidine kinase inhibitor